MRPAFLFVFSLFVPLTSIMCSARAETTQTVRTFERTITRDVGYKYLLALPAGYEAKGDRRWPLLLFLHGSGERGNDVWSAAKHGPPKLLALKPPAKERGTRDPAHLARKLIAENFIVVSPQCAKNEWWDTEALLALLDEVSAQHRVDRGRVYLTGLSMGGFGVWSLGLAHPERFAAIAPVCGGGDFGTLLQAHFHKRAALRGLAVWAFHGAKDESVPVAESQRMIDALGKFKVEDVRLTVYPDAAHDSWTETYANPELYTWFLQHVRRPAAGAK